MKSCCRRAIEKHISTPEVENFIRAVKREAAHQKKAWKATDPLKTSADWYWLVGYLGGKALMDPHEESDARSKRERRMHRIITVAAACLHWHEATRNREV